MSNSVLFFADQPGEPEVIMPVLIAAFGRDDITLAGVVSSRVKRHRPQFLRRIAQLGIAVSTLPTDRDAAQAALTSLDLGRFNAVLAPVTSNHPSHALSNFLVARARAAGVTSYAMQHGLDNIGLTRCLSADGQTEWTIAADRVFVWFPRDHIPAACPPALRPRLHHVGRPALQKQDARRPTGRFRVGVFENLHWDLYDDAFRVRFVTDLLQAAALHREIDFVVKPIPAGDG